MFNKTRMRLAVLNAAVFLLILGVLSSLLYVHMRYRLFHDVDEILQQAERQVLKVHKLTDLHRADHWDPGQDERTIYLFWNARGELIDQLPPQSFSSAEANRLRASTDATAPTTVHTQEGSYRALRLPNSRPGADQIASITIVRSLQDVRGTLRTLLWDIAAGMIAGVGISILSGFFLAGKAFIPIRRSWEKQQRFVADASHELRTPTAVISAQTELLLRYPRHSIEQESPNIAVILKESKRMGKLVDDLLTLARTDSNQLQIQAAVIALDRLLEEIAEQFRSLAETMEIRIVTDIHTPLFLWGDEGRIRQLLVILLDNALKFTPPSGRIDIVGRYHAHSVNVGVIDSGCGIAEKELPHIFERFYRGDKVRSRDHGGTGLGLSIAQWIVQAHGGEIRVHSKVGAGTNVELFLPRKKLGPAESEAASTT